jgi:hypothetical protein
VVLTLLHLCSQLQPMNLGLGPHASVQLGAPFERIAIDIAGPFPQSNQGNWYLVIAIHNYACHHLKLASDRMRMCYDCLANSVGYQEGNQVWLYRPTHTKGRSPKLQPSWEGLYKVVTWINNVVYRIQWHPRTKMMVVHLDLLAPYQGSAWDEQP